MSEAPKRPVALLAFTRKYGWVVVEPDDDGAAPGVVLGFTRLSHARVLCHQVLATHPLPPVPEEAA